MIWLNYHHLYYFYKVVEAGSITNAARELRIGQPTLSSQLKELESRFGQLFDRRSRVLVLNERGKLVYKYAKDIFTRGEELVQVIERGELALQPELVMGAQEGVPKAIISKTLERLRIKTNLKIRVIEGNAPILLDNLLDGAVDLVIFDHELIHSSKTIIYLPVGQEQVYFLGSKKYKNLSKNFPHSLSNVPLIVSNSGHPLRHAVENFFIAHDLRLEIAIEAPDTALIKELGRSGAGVIALGEETAGAWVQAGSLYKIGMLSYKQKYSLGILKKFLKDPLSEIIVKEFKGTKK